MHVKPYAHYKSRFEFRRAKNKVKNLKNIDDLNLEEIRIDDDDGNVVVHNAL